MTERNQLYKCAICGNIVGVNHAGAGELVCCGQAMNLLVANTEDAATEKHVPVVSVVEDKIQVVVGEVEHPMEEAHYIEWISLVSENETKTVFLAPGDKPEAIFDSVEEKYVIYAYCNLHGLWKVGV